MLAYIKGILEMKMTGFVAIDVNGIGYKVYMSDLAIEKLGNIGDVVKVYTHYRVREDDISIFGFNTNEELQMFELLLGVSGIGSKIALTAVASIHPSDFALAVVSEDVDSLTNISGVGKKSAQRIILELKDKLKNGNMSKKDINNNVEKKLLEKNIDEEAISALQVLGYNKKEIQKALEKVDKSNLSVEELIRKGLTFLSM